jgi:hypothetical protein
MNRYRIVLRWLGFEPQMKCQSGLAGWFWTPLLATGYWAEPESFTAGLVKSTHPLGLRAALAAVQRAKRINSGGLLQRV